MAGGAELARALKPSGRPRVVHVWAPWCAPCVAEWPRLAPAIRGWSRSVDVVTIALDEPSRRKDAARLLVLAQRGVTRLPALEAEIERATRHGASGARDVPDERRR